MFASPFRIITSLYFLWMMTLVVGQDMIRTRQIKLEQEEVASA
jgi:hypothetical protein